MCEGTDGEAYHNLLFGNMEKLSLILLQPFKTCSGHHHQTKSISLLQAKDEASNSCFTVLSKLG